jgi:uncharacterized protein with von Willebrand factor type A (vWA) domain
VSTVEELLLRFERLAALASLSTDLVERDRLSDRVVQREAAREPLVTAAKVRTVALVKDLFTVFWERQPQLRPAHEVRPDLRGNLRTLSYVVRARNTYGLARYDEFEATLATLAVLEHLDQPVDMDALTALVGGDDLDALEAALDAAEQSFGDDSPRELGEVTAALDAARTRAAEETALAMAWGFSRSELSNMSVADRLTLTKRLSTPALRRLADELGRDVTSNSGASLGVSVTRSGQFSDVAPTSELEDTLPSQRARFGTTNPVVRLLTLRDFADGALLGEVREEQVFTRGPVVVLVDCSESMTSHHQDGLTREAWAKSVALGVLGHAPDREVHLALFSGPGEWRSWRFPAAPERRRTEDTLAFVESTFRGGTDLVGAVDRALGLIEERSSLTEADLIVMTDGQVCLPSQWAIRVNRRKVALRSAFKAVVIGPETLGDLDQICDDIRTVEELCRPGDTARALTGEHHVGEQSGER